MKSAKVIPSALCIVAWACAASQAGQPSPIHAAAAAGDVSQIERILERTPSAIDGRDASGQAPLHLALRNLHVEAGEHLLTAGANVNVKDKHGSTALHVLLAVARGKKEVPRRQRSLVALLLQRGADVRATDGHGKTPLHIAVSTGRRALLNMLLRAGADIAAVDHLGRTPLHDAVLANKAAAINWLLSNGAEVDAVDKQGNTPLHCAVLRFRSGPTGQLLVNGAKVDARNHRGETPLHLTGSAGPEEKEVDLLLAAVAGVLLDAGADVNAVDSQGYTPLHHTLAKNREKLAEQLSRHGGKE